MRQLKLQEQSTLLEQGGQEWCVIRHAFSLIRWLTGLALRCVEMCGTSDASVSGDTRSLAPMPPELLNPARWVHRTTTQHEA